MAAWHIGTSGWSYDRWKETFYPAGLPANRWLAFYVTRFNAVEINNTFYHLPSSTQIGKWENQAPKDFTFCIKAWRRITHSKKLKDPEQTLPPLMQALADQRKISPVLFQLPPHFPANLDRLRSLLCLLPKNRRFAIEFRDPSWHDDSVYTLLRQHNVAFCLFEKGKLRSPRLATADFIYVRLHGRKENYKGNYSRRALTDWRDWLAQQDKDIYLFFDNTDEKLFAIENALMFKELVNLY